MRFAFLTWIRLDGAKSDDDGVTKDKIRYSVFAMVGNPTYIDYILYLPRNLIHFLMNLCNAFGWKFVVIVCIVYGLQQGVTLFIIRISLM